MFLPALAMHAWVPYVSDKYLFQVFDSVQFPIWVMRT